MTESQLLRDVIRALYPYCVLYRINVGSVKTADGRRFSTGAPAGYSDLSGYRKSDGRAVFIECKLAYNKPSEKQAAFLEKAKQNHCLCGVARSVEEALQIIMGD